MKKYTWVILGMFIFFQTHGQITYGIKEGLNVSNEIVALENTAITLKSNTGFNVGLIFDYSLGSVSIQPGLMYSQKGSNISVLFISVESECLVSTKTLDYLDLPLNVIYKKKTGVFTFFLNTGPSYSVCIDGFGQGDPIAFTKIGANSE